MHIKKLFDLKGKIAIVTGAVGQLGTQMAIALSEAGANVVIGDLNLSDCQRKAKAIGKNVSQCMGVELDVTKKKSVQKMTALVLKRFGYRNGDCPNAENYYSRAITLPVFPKISEQDINDVIKAVKKVINYYKK